MPRATKSSTAERVLESRREIVMIALQQTPMPSVAVAMACMYTQNSTTVLWLKPARECIGLISVNQNLPLR
jgi:hypothetical protein